MTSSTGTLNQRSRPSSQNLLTLDGWFAYSWRNPGGAEPGDPAAPTATAWVRWGGGSFDRMIAIGNGRLNGTGISESKNIVFPDDGTTVPVSNGTVRTVAPASATLSTDYGGIALAPWESLYVLVDWSKNTQTIEQFLVVRGNSADDNSRLLVANDYQEWLLICSVRWGGTLTLWNGDTIRKGQEIGSVSSMAAQVNHDRAQLDATIFRGVGFLTQTEAFGWLGSVQRLGHGGSGPSWGENSADFSNPPVGTTVRQIGGTGSGTDAGVWRAPVAADQMYMFGALQSFTDTATLLDRVPGGTDTLYFHRRVGFSATATRPVPAVTGWYRVSADTNSNVQPPTSWIPVATNGSILPDATGAYIPLAKAVLARNDAIYYDAAGRAVGAAAESIFTVPPSARWTTATFIQPGAVANGSTRFTVAERGIMIGWDDSTLVHALGKTAGSYLRGQPSTYLQVPPVGYGIPVIGMPGATRVVQAIAGTTRRFIPLARDEILFYRGSPSTGYNDRGWLVFPVAATILTPLNDMTYIASWRGSADGGSGGGAPVRFAGDIIIAPGLYKGATPETWGDEADSHNLWMTAIVPGGTPPGGTAALGAVTGVTGAFPGVAPEYVVMRSADTHRKVCRVRGALQLSGNVPSPSSVLFLPGVRGRGSTRIQVTVHGTGSASNKPRTVAAAILNGAVGGQNGALISVYGANTTANPGLTQGDAAWGTPSELWFDFSFDVY